MNANRPPENCTADREKGKQKKLWVVGIGPGSFEDMTIRAASILKECDCIVGYSVYLDLVRDHFPDKEYLSTGMRHELERCRMAFEQAALGKKTAMVCSGDAGVYGMAGPVLQISPEYPETEVEIVPGVTSALSGAALLGAPLMHDFCLISLSDLMTDFQIIEERILAAAGADFVIVLYNPSSRKRADYLQKACRLILKFRGAGTPCGCASRIGREGENIRLMSLGELCSEQTDMFTTVFIGSSRTSFIDGKMVTDRGYRNSLPKS